MKGKKKRQKCNHFQAKIEPRKGPRSSPLPRAPFSLGILSLESESLSGSNANTGSIVILQRQPHLHCLGFLRAYPIELWLRQTARRPSIQGGDLCWFIAQEMPGKSLCCPVGSVKSGAKCGCSLIESRGLDQNRWWPGPACLSTSASEILGWTFNYLESSKKILCSVKCPKGFSWNLGNGAALFEIDEVHKMV